MDNNFFTFYDEEGNEIMFELVASFKVNDTDYALLRPEDSPEDEVIVCRVTQENGEEVLELVTDDEEIMMAFEAYEELADEATGQKRPS